MGALEQPIGAVIEGVAGGTAVAVSGTVTTGGLTDAELRASDVAITLDSEIAGTAEQPREYLGDETIAGNDGSQNATLPAGTTSIWMFPDANGQGNAVVNGSASATTGFYAPADGARFIGPYNNITSLGVYAATGTNVFLVYEGEA